MEIKVVQVNFAFKVYRSGETTAHISSVSGGMRVVAGAVKGKERKGIKERKGR